MSFISTSFTLRPKQNEALKMLALLSDRSLSAEVRRLIDAEAVRRSDEIEAWRKQNKGRLK